MHEKTFLHILNGVEGWVRVDVETKVGKFDSNMLDGRPSHCDLGPSDNENNLVSCHAYNSSS